MTASRRHALPALLLAALLCSALVHAAPPAPHVARGTQLTGQVVGVSDGDTLTVLTADKQSLRVRLAQIDAPEKRQAFGAASKQSLSDLAFGKPVRVAVQDTDRYGRLVAHVWTAQADLNATQVQRGMAWAYVQYLTDPRIAELEREARAARRGLWSEPNPTAPWLFRREARKPKGP